MSGGRRWRTGSSDDSSSEEAVVVNAAGAAAPASAARPAASGQNGQEQGLASTASRQELIALREAHHKKLESLYDERRRIRESCWAEKEKIQEITRRLGDHRDEVVVPVVGAAAAAAAKVGEGSAIKNYFDRFEWSERLKRQMECVFGIKGFRLAQEGVCNANMDGRDIICIMPTGGGKSLTYQLPATLMPGCTLVVSPLVALIKDQVFHLQEKRIEYLTFTSKMPKAKITEGYDRLRATVRGNDPTGKEVKLCYVTPERLAISKEFKSIVKEMVAANKLARIVIDEAHCISQLGRDYRPDYKHLDHLRILYPSVPILALSATCPANVLRDLIAILGLRALTNGTAAKPLGTVLFTSPQYRKNLHYKVIPKSPKSQRIIWDMVKYIQDHHPNETGIVYCLSRADAERVAEGLCSQSGGEITTGIYHAEIDDKAKEELHENWLMGLVKVVCATTAFGLGVNKANVRFVLHHSMPKSLETFYQESGRAGRDGEDADCVLYYRFQDALRSPGMKADGDWQQQEAHNMIKFCLDLKECRKLKFAKHFSSSDFSWAEDNTPCGHCDNCLRDPASIVEKDATSEGKRVLLVARGLASKSINITGVQLARSARGTDRYSKALNLAKADKVALSLVDMEVLVARLLLEGYLEKYTTENAYTVQVYLKPSPERNLDGGQKLVIQLPHSGRAARGDPSALKSRSGKRRKAAPENPRKRKSTEVYNSDNDNDIDNDNDNDNGEEEEEDGDFGDCSGEDGEIEEIEAAAAAGPSESASGSPAKRLRSNDGSSCVPTSPRSAAAAAAIARSNASEWTGNLRGAPAATHRPLTRSGSRRSVGRKSAGRGTPKRGFTESATLPLDNEVIDISTD